MLLSHPREPQIYKETVPTLPLPSQPDGASLATTLVGSNWTRQDYHSFITEPMLSSGDKTPEQKCTRGERTETLRFCVNFHLLWPANLPSSTHLPILLAFPLWLQNSHLWITREPPTWPLDPSGLVLASSSFPCLVVEPKFPTENTTESLASS